MYGHDCSTGGNYIDVEGSGTCTTSTINQETNWANIDLILRLGIFVTQKYVPCRKFKDGRQREKTVAESKLL
jgi:hypothetical protein